ncbi:hypothetical protein AB0C51_04825 [Streptomyces pathocidini]|uniref:DUF4034 domain-containing protein n=1 Tax=Streptomyces pathocidini TaxID=1650571 RepID=A0ABW7UUH6_9ACTN|nr:hypothetical protein [Streptomyces pathocidini]
METLLILLALTMIGGLVVVPVLRRMRGGRAAQRGHGSAIDPGQYGFAPPDRLDVRLPGPDPELAEALEDIRRTQDWRPAAQLLATTTGAGAWELRWQRVQTLAGAAAAESAEAPGDGGRWLRTWRAEAPKDAGGAVVHAEFLVRQAWQSSAGPGSDEYRIILEEARTVCAGATLLAPGDPTPYIVELAVARGLAYREADFEELWAKVTSRAPQHMGAHLAALHYWCEKWHGSKEKADAFAQGAAGSAQAQEKSLLPALPLFAVFEHLPEVNVVRGLYESEVVGRAVQGALFAARSVPADHPVLPHVRHLLVWFLVRAERYAEAMEQLGHVDGHVGAVPWSYEPDPVGVYAAYRAQAVAGWERAGGTPATMPR